MSEARIRLFVGERVFMVTPLEPPIPETATRSGWISVDMGGQSWVGRLDEVDAWLSPEAVRKAVIEWSSSH